MAIMTVATSFAQKEKLATRDGNEALKKGELEKAKTAYNKALQENPEYKEAQFNLGNVHQKEARALMERAQQEKDEEAKKKLLKQAGALSKKAAEQYQNLATQLTEPEEINKTQYNLGNAQLLGGQLDKSIDAYKEALRSKPDDDEARYNLAFAQSLKKEQQKKQKQKKKQGDKKDQQKKEDQKKKDQDQQKQDQQKNGEQKQEHQKNKMSKEEAEKMLEALMKKEKDLQEDLNKKKRKAQRIRIEKDW
jgi:tetratricopeptide (TPR) repeat protein